MKLKHAAAVLLSFLLISPTVFAQDAKQKLNDEFWEAVRKGDLAAVTALLDKGADVNAKFRYGSTALFKAAERGHTEIVKLLLARGADVTVKDTFYGATAMTWALSNGHVETIRALLEKDSSGVDDVLMTGVREGNVALVEVALAKGGAKAETLTAALAAAMNDKEKSAIADMLRKAGAVPPVEIESATLQTYVGRYKNEQGIELSLTVKDGKPFLTAPGGQPPFALMAIDKTSFRPTAFEGLVVTVNIEGGRAASLSVKQGTNTTIFKRVEETKQ
ncbi:MAG: ankyrin repeat domain-containing protein [Acidobacteriota bacterium]